MREARPGLRVVDNFKKSSYILIYLKHGMFTSVLFDMKIILKSPWSAENWHWVVCF